MRGLSSLVILERLMYQINADPEAHVSDYFDMIAGTSTGGWALQHNFLVLQAYHLR